MRTRRKAWKALLATLLTILGLELALRWHYRDRGWPSIYRPDAELGWTLRPLWRGRYQHRPTTINELGLRDGRDGAAWRSAPRRLLILGDSVAFGYGVAEGQHLAPQLDALLRPRGWAVATAAVSGYDTELEARWLERYGPDLAPDAVLLAYCQNDEQRATADHLGESVGLSALAITERSALAYKLLKEVERLRRRRRMGPFAPAKGSAPPAEPAGGRAIDVSAALVRLNAWCGARGLPFAVALFPLATDLVNIHGEPPTLRLMRQRCEGLGLKPLELLEPFRGLPEGPGLYLPGDICHLSPDGHQAAARILASQLQSTLGLPSADPHQVFDK